MSADTPLPTIDRRVTEAASPVSSPSRGERSRSTAGGSFLRVVRAELRRFSRPRSVLALVVGAALFAIVSSVAVWVTAEADPQRSRDGAASLIDLAARGGATEAFTVGASFGGLVVLVTFIAVMGNELATGTLRTLLLVYPRRGRLLLGKMVGLLLVTAVVVVLAELFSVIGSVLLAPTRAVSTSAWWDVESVGDALFDYVTVVAGLVGWALLGTVVVAVVRSVPIALGVGISWFGPGENFVFESVEGAAHWFPGQVLGSLMRAGTVELSLGRALVTAATYALAALLVIVATTRRDLAR